MNQFMTLEERRAKREATRSFRVSRKKELKEKRDNLTPDQIQWLEDHRVKEDRVHDHKVCCLTCKRMKSLDQFAFKTALRCMVCDKSDAIAQLFTTRLYSLVSGRIKHHRIERFLGCNRDQLLKHLESLFVDGMGWHNRNLWHIDHIIPVSHFNHNNDDEVQKCWNYMNLRPLWAHLNLKKSNKLDTGI